MVYNKNMKENIEINLQAILDLDMKINKYKNLLEKEEIDTFTAEFIENIFIQYLK